MKLLFTDATILAPSRLIAKGYVYIEDDTIKALGEGEPPLEYQYAELVSGGEGRVIIPGFIAKCTPSIYPFRGVIGAKDILHDHEVAKLIKSLSYEEAYYAALLALYELSYSGYTSVIAIDPNIDAVAKAISDVGIHGIVLIPVGCELQPSNPLKTIEASLEKFGKSRRVQIGILVCGEAGDIVEEAKKMGLVVAREEQVKVEGWIGSPWIELSMAVKELGVEKAIEKVLLEPYKFLNVDQPLSENSIADLVIVDISEPPSWTPSIERIAWGWFVGSTPRIETVVSAGELIVDGGQHLHVGPEVCRRAQLVLEKRAVKLS